MSEFKEVVSDFQLRVVAGGNIAVLNPGEPRALNPDLFEAAVAMGAKPCVAESEPAEAPASEDAPKKRRKRKRARTETAIITAAVKAIDKLTPEDFAPTGEPRMAALRDEVPDLTPELRDKAWDLVVATAREKK